MTTTKDIAAVQPADPTTMAEGTAGPSTSPETFPEVLVTLRETATTETPASTAPQPSWQPGQAAVGAAGSITHLWSYDAATGVWVVLNGNWKRLSPNSEHGHTDLIILASIATHANLGVDYHEDAGGQIDYMYV